MRRADMIVVLLLVSLGGFVAYQALGVDRSDSAPSRNGAAAPGHNTSAGSSVAPGANVRVSTTALPPPVRDLSAIRQHLLTHEHGTYIGEILAARDSGIARWTDRQEKPVTVWIDERSPLAGPDQALARNVRRAFVDWGQAGVPIAYTFVNDSAHVDVKVTFIDHFDKLMSGRTLWTRDTNWWILGGDIQLSLRSGSGRLLTSDQLYAIALHEVGHLLGLDHTRDSSAIMAPRVSALGLTPQDVATMRLIYEVPPGSVKAAR